MSRLQSGLLIANRYRLLSKIGSGGFSEVWIAEDTRGNQLKVALKIFATDNGLDSEGLAVFSREYSLVFNLNHPHLLKPMHYDDWEGMPYLVMQFMPQGSVMRYCGRMSEQELARFLVQIGDALRYLHEQDPPIVHQDIKPANVLIDGHGNYYLSDFGISTKIRRTLSRSMGRRDEDWGTTAYMAPERFSNRLRERLPIEANDIFSLGVTMFELLTDELPYGEMGGVVAAGGLEPAELPERFSRELRELISACLSRDFRNRPTAKEIVKAARMYLETGRWGYGGAEPEPARDPLTKAIEEGEIRRFVEEHEGTPVQGQIDGLYYELTRRYGSFSREEFDRVMKEEMQKTRPYAISSDRSSDLPEGKRRATVWWYVMLVSVLVAGFVIGIVVDFNSLLKIQKMEETVPPESLIESSRSSYTETYGGLNMDMVWLEGGDFWMGCTPVGDIDCRDDEFPRHKVTLAGFWMGRTEVTNAQFCVFLNEKGNKKEGGVEWINLRGSHEGEKCRINRKGSRYEVERGYEQYPVIYVSWYGARAFAAWLSERTGWEYRLPSEAQWEYACRSRGKEYKYAWGSGNPTMRNGGNFGDNSWNGWNDGHLYTAPVGSFGVNEAGLSDMSGNVWEWCEDRWHGNYNGAPTDGSARIDGTIDARCVRGGSWFSDQQRVRCSYRLCYSPTERYRRLGFRLVRIK